MNPIMVRISIFILLLMVLLLWEYFQPQRQALYNKKRRWLINFGLTIMNSLMVMALPVSSIATAIWIEQQQWGVFNNISLPASVELIIGVLLLDFAIYWQHVLFHRIPLLWRLHSVHHTDGDIDVSTALRFHPLEIVLSLMIKIALIMVLGLPVLTVAVFEIILNGMAMFNHGNIRLGSKLDYWLQKIVVTPNMHVFHHSQKTAEMNSNFGFNLSLWDRMFASYRAYPGHDPEHMGIAGTEFVQQANIIYLLDLPRHSCAGQR